MNRLAFASTAAAASIRKFINVLNGFSGGLPVKPGMYWMICEETEYVPELLKITRLGDGTLIAEGYPIDYYDFQSIMWKRFSPGAGI